MQSHIIPAFVFRWLKETGGTDYLRSGSAPNRRVQDGLKMRLLCAICEGRLSVWEKTFAETVFQPVSVDIMPSGSYRPWYSKFVASLLFRIGARYEILEASKKFEDHRIERELADCLEAWRRFILDEVSSPGRFELHMVPVGQLGDAPGDDVPHNWNRYIHRHVEMDLAYNESKTFVALFCKIGPVAFFGHVRNTRMRWRGSRISVAHGFHKQAKVVLPREVLGYFFWRAKNNDTISRSISPTQIEKTNSEIMKDLDRMAGSEMFAALLADADRFGVSAVTFPAAKVVSPDDSGPT